MSWIDGIECLSEAHKHYLLLINHLASYLALDEAWFHREQDGKFEGREPANMLLSEEGAREVQQILETMRYRKLVEKHARTLELGEDWFARPQFSQELRGRVPNEMLKTEEGVRELARILESVIEENPELERAASIRSRYSDAVTTRGNHSEC